jgi:hypothetical protein
MKQKKIEKVLVVEMQFEDMIINDLKSRIKFCPNCGVDLSGAKSCASINCPCAPRITC